MSRNIDPLKTAHLTTLFSLVIVHEHSSRRMGQNAVRVQMALVDYQSIGMCYSSKLTILCWVMPQSMFNQANWRPEQGAHFQSLAFQRFTQPCKCSRYPRRKRTTARSTQHSNKRPVGLGSNQPPEYIHTDFPLRCQHRPWYFRGRDRWSGLRFRFSPRQRRKVSSHLNVTERCDQMPHFQTL